MELKDIWTVSVSSIALIVSLISVVLTLRQKKYENERTIRNQLTDTISKLIALSIENQRNRGLGVEGDIINLNRIFNSQRRYLVEQSIYLMEKIEKLVTDVEYNIIAIALATTGDTEKANLYYSKCVDTSPNDTYKLYNTRGYARFLFNNVNHEAGRRKYQEALENNLPDNDRYRYERGDTYLMWAEIEYDHGYKEESKRLFDRAESIFNSIGKQSQKERGLARLYKKKINLFKEDGVA